MYNNQYELLNGVWKSYFDFFSLKKTDHKDLSPFKLSYNEELFKVLFSDQSKRSNRGKSAYEDIARGIFDRVEKDKFVRNKKGISLDSMKGAILESDIITGIHLQEIDKHKYPILIVKCYVSTMTLNDEEVLFMTTALPCHLDNDSSGLTIAVASIPIMKKSTTKKEEMVFKWAVRKSISQLEKYYSKVYKTSPRKEGVVKMCKNIIEDVLVKYCL